MQISKARNLFIRSLAQMACIALFSTGTAIADTAAKHQKSPQKPSTEKQLPNYGFENESKGQEAYDRLKNSGRLNQFATTYELDEQSVREMFLNDPKKRARLDKQGRLFFVEELDATPADATVTPNTVTIDPSQTFLLNSKPNASKTIYLDFNGYTATGTAWNASYGIDPIVNPALDLDGSPTTLSAAEHTLIQGIWKRVSEDYAAFDVNITTQEPAADKITRSSSTDTFYGTRVVITKNFTANSTRGNCNCGGFAYVGIFSSTSEYYKPAYVFSDMLGNSEKNIAEAISHEAGHNLGLSHDGTSTTGYYQGHGSGETGWAPIMGVGYSKNLVQWSKGEYPGANNTQDDYLVMQGQGLFFEADDHGNTSATGTALSATVSNGLNAYSERGIIQGPNDVDAFKFVSAIGTVNVNISAFQRSANLDVLATILNANGEPIAELNPDTTLGLTASFNAPADGTYTVLVQGTGRVGATGTTDFGYPRYGSTGHYQINVSAPISGVNQAPIAVLNASATQGTAPLTVAFNSNGSYDPDGSLASIVWDFGDGTGATGPSVSKTYSAVGSFTASLTVIDQQGVSASKSVSITTTQPVTLVPMRISSITMNGTATGKNKRATATVTVIDSDGRPVPNATVSGTWSGVVSSTSSGVTSTSGSIAIASPPSKRSGTWIFTVNQIQASGFVYDSGLNTQTSGSITF